MELDGTQAPRRQNGAVPGHGEGSAAAGEKLLVGSGEIIQGRGSNASPGRSPGAMRGFS